jgi:hypothetical protein
LKLYRSIPGARLLGRGVPRPTSAFGTKLPIRDVRSSVAIWGTADMARTGTWRELLDHLVGATEDRRRNGEAEGLGCVQIDDQFENGRLLDRQVGGLGALEDRSGINADLSIGRRKARVIADQAAGRGVFTDPIDRRNGMACRQRHDLIAPAIDEWFGGDDERVGGA